jgi:hypothetical protein
VNVVGAGNVDDALIESSPSRPSLVTVATPIGSAAGDESIKRGPVTTTVGVKTSSSSTVATNAAAANAVDAPALSSGSESPATVVITVPLVAPVTTVTVVTIPAASTAPAVMCEPAPLIVCAGLQLGNVDFQYANLQGADFTGANLSGADLTGADLTDARFVGANLTGATLDYAFLFGTDFSGARIGRATFADVLWDDSTVFPAGFVPPY